MHQRHNAPDLAHILNQCRLGVGVKFVARLRAGARTFADAGADLGYFGDPARATAEEGHAMLDALADIIIGAIPWH